MNLNVGKEGKNSKCLRMHVGDRTGECLELIVRGKPIEKVEEVNFPRTIVSSRIKSSKDIKERIRKGMGVISNIFIILGTI